MYDKIAQRVGITSEECLQRIKKFENDIHRFLLDSGSGSEYHNDLQIKLISNDLRVVYHILNYLLNIEVHCLKDNNVLLEMVILYYYIMEIFHEDYTLDSLENYFGILNFKNLIIDNVSLFSKPYMKYKLIQRNIHD